MSDKRKFEYMVKDNALISSEWLNELGQEGWELTAVYDGYYFFKRELPQKQGWFAGLMLPVG